MSCGCDASGFNPDIGSDKVKVDSSDTTAGFLAAKLSAGTNITLTVTNPGANEGIRIDAGAPVLDHKVAASGTDTTPNFLLPKLAAGAAIALTLLNGGGNEQVRVAVSGLDLTSAAVTSGPANTFLKGTGAGNVWANLFSAPANPGDNGKPAIALSGDFSYAFLVDANVDATAAIAGTKISPNFGSQDIATTGNLLLGATPRATVGTVRLGTGATVAVRKSDNSADLTIITASDSTTFGSSAGDTVVQAFSTLSFVRNAVTIMQVTTGVTFLANTVQWNNAQTAPTLSQSARTAAGTASSLTISAQGCTAAASTGGDLVLNGGSVTNAGASGTAGRIVATAGNANSGTSGVGGDFLVVAGTGFNTQSNGRVVLRRGSVGGTIENMLEITGKLGAAQRLISLLRTLDITATQMPANTGDLVMYVGDAATAPSADAVSGHIYYSNGAMPAWRFNGHNLRLDALAVATATAGGGQAVPGTVLGYLQIQIDGATVGKIPYFAN